MSEKNFRPLAEYREFPPEEMGIRANEFYSDMRRRRSVRQFSDRPIDRKIIENCIRTASTAPSGANLQPWHFVVVSDPTVKKQIHRSAEEIEHEFYSGESTKKWVKDLEHLGTSDQKPFLLTAPYLIVVFAQRHGLDLSGEQKKHYYVTESVGIATGILITAIHHTGLASLTYTPGKMGFLNKILSRPSNEKPYMILVVGYPGDDALVPDIEKKELDEITTFI
jgi:nitroreductase